MPPRKSKKQLNIIPNHPTTPNNNTPNSNANNSNPPNSNSNPPNSNSNPPNSNSNPPNSNANNSNHSNSNSNPVIPEIPPSEKPKRAPNFSPEEDEQLAKSWTVISEDAITSNNQSKDVFWERVVEDFNMSTSGPRRDDSGLSTRWKALQKSVLKFGAIYDRLKNNPASGSTPEDWLINARQLYYEQVGKQFMSERSWNLLKHVPKFQNLAGRAKPGTSSQIASESQFLSQPANDSSQPSSTNAETPTSKNWERLLGAHSSKRKVNEEEYKRRRMKYWEVSHKEALKRSVEAKRSNDIQEDLVATENKKIDFNLMFQNPNSCPDDISRRFLMKQKEEIYKKYSKPPSSRVQGESSKSVTDHSSEPSSRFHTSDSEPMRDETNESEKEYEDIDEDEDDQDDDLPTHTQILDLDDFSQSV
ncbi:uncharacterized protein PGTG_22017 [Puccinia graminis f. sp. tritici CRL 75-36-700-3]|uniref:No apical meristem-associated C-terminal domain-containing protein n=1 Tax=Puccinia graminis f. sp. tritici (strain CRL 75-36-700-3 / race SCCL) TaxID=418459 RepID=H6QT58_PUCGT|nr:uncharacterized protein PGTG_22017 [Puccinia graminis f. sp. tritici CRL 75-36-700-3]EHS64019.1 hypothetical protein PGTG_22017 [Puccinia graminis f. sp. tritici CRL 75-36-700-3]